MSSQEEESEPGQKNNQLLQLEEKTHKEEKKERGVVSNKYNNLNSLPKHMQYHPTQRKNLMKYIEKSQDLNQHQHFSILLRTFTSINK